MSCFSRDQHACEMWDYTGDYYNSFSNMLCVCLRHVFLLFSLTPFFSRLQQEFQGAVWKIVHHAQEHAEAVWKYRQLFCLWPPLGQRGRILRRTGQLSHALHGKCKLSDFLHMNTNMFLQSRRIQWLTEATTHTCAYFCTHLLAHTGCQCIENRGCVLHMHTFSSNFQGPDRWWKLVRKLHCYTFMDELE